MTQRELLKEKFEEKFPVQFEGCRNQPFTFLFRDHECYAYNVHLHAVCTFTYLDEQDYSLEIKVKRK